MCLYISCRDSTLGTAHCLIQSENLLLACTAIRPSAGSAIKETPSVCSAATHRPLTTATTGETKSSNFRPAMTVSTVSLCCLLLLGAVCLTNAAPVKREAKTLDRAVVAAKFLYDVLSDQQQALMEQEVTGNEQQNDDSQNGQADNQAYYGGYRRYGGHYGYEQQNADSQNGQADNQGYYYGGKSYGGYGGHGGYHYGKK